MFFFPKDYLSNGLWTPREKDSFPQNTLTETNSSSLKNNRNTKMKVSQPSHFQVRARKALGSV